MCAAVMALVYPAIASPTAARAQSTRERHPMMSSDQPVSCYRDATGDTWRVQCNAEARVCLYAPNVELDTRGRRTGKALERARRCPAFDREPLDRAALEARGYQFVPGRADAPYGWTRDSRGRVFQVNFDLRRRGYLGGSYAPAAVIDGDMASSRSSADFGLLLFDHYGGPAQPNRHRVRLVEGEVFLDPFSAELVLAHYDLSRRFIEPLLRITTFFGEPERHDLRLNLGVWAEAGHLEVHHTAVDSHLWRFATAQATLDVWQSADLSSFARVRTGIGVERLYVDDRANRTALTAGSAFEIDWVLDRSGFHNLRGEIAYEVPHYVAAGLGRAERLGARVRYEAILLAINDQPLSLRLDAGSEKRSDIPGLPPDWAFVANAGLRFSLWAPPRSPQ